MDGNLIVNPYEGLAIQPDGTPMKFGVSVNHTYAEWCVCAFDVQKSLITRAGGVFNANDPQLDVNKQVAWMEDMIAAGDFTGTTMMSVDNNAVAPVVCAAEDAGLPVFVYDVAAFCDKRHTFVEHDFLSDFGVNLLGEWLIEEAEKTGRHINVFEVWGQMSNVTSQMRNQGFHLAVDARSDMVTVFESADTGWSPEVTNEFIIDAFTANPELNAVYVHGGGNPGAIAALRTLGLTAPFGDPEHVYLVTVDMDISVAEGIRGGVLDACLTHGSWDLVDTCVKLMFRNTILAEPSPYNVIIPMQVVTAANIDSVKILGGPGTWPDMPQGYYDLWPVLDVEKYSVIDKEGKEFHIQTPTAAERMEKVGY
jgi:ABC-type sugar transport system substrate-binding protein